MATWAGYEAAASARTALFCRLSFGTLVPRAMCSASLGTLVPHRLVIVLAETLVAVWAELAFAVSSVS